MKNYVKPSMKKVALISEKVLANPCWSLADNNGLEKFYFDHNGRDDGFYHFEVHKGNCGNNDNGRYLYYHSGREAVEGTQVDFTGEHGANFDAFIKELAGA